MKEVCEAAFTALARGTAANPASDAALELPGQRLRYTGLSEIGRAIDAATAAGTPLPRAWGLQGNQLGFGALEELLPKLPGKSTPNPEAPTAGIIQRLDVSDNPVQDDGAAVLQRWLSGREDALETLILRSCEIGAIGASQLAAVPATQAPKTLDLSWNPIGGEGCGSLGAEWQGESLLLQGCGVSDGMAQDLVTGLFQVEAAPHLTQLDLSTNPLGANAVQSFVAMVQDWGSKERHGRPPPRVLVHHTKADTDKVKELGMAWAAFQK